jgi:hypothetical protein
LSTARSTDRGWWLFLLVWESARLQKVDEFFGIGTRRGSMRDQAQTGGLVMPFGHSDYGLYWRQLAGRCPVGVAVSGLRRSPRNEHNLAIIEYYFDIIVVCVIVCGGNRSDPGGLRQLVFPKLEPIEVESHVVRQVFAGGLDLVRAKCM